MSLTTPAGRIEALRSLLREQGLAAYIVPSADPHQSEYVAAHWQARAWLSGFRGSAGTLVATADQAGLWTDPRYHIRAAQELAGSGVELFKGGLPGTPSLIEWLGGVLPSGSAVGCDGALLSMNEAAALENGFSTRGLRLTPTADLLDSLWTDRPLLPLAPVFLYEDVYAGESRAAKLARIRAGLAGVGAQFHLLCALDDIAWTLNLRGADIDYNPVAVCYALIGENDAQLFIEPEKVPAEVRAALQADGVKLLPYAGVQGALTALPAGSTVLLDPEKTAVRLRGLVPEGCRVREGTSLPYLMKTVKNTVEIEGLRAMQVRDGAALARWLCWLDSHVAEGYTEITAAEVLRDFRARDERFRSLSFGTIAGYGSNSAVGHYQSDPLTAPTLQPEGIFLIDSGGQYLDGTSDITRTITLGGPTYEQKRVFTTVLKSHIRLASAHFPRGTRGLQLDAAAREVFWREGWNCRHGIGHGVGHFLNVHENPPRFNEINTTVLQPGMLVSNEPGVYFEGRFGVRIENLVLVVEAGRGEFGDFLAFETVSLCPIDLDLVDASLLNEQERAWLNAYHQRVFAALSPHLEPGEREWLIRETRAI